MSRYLKVKMYRERPWSPYSSRPPAGRLLDLAVGRHGCDSRVVVRIVVEAREPGRQPVHRRLGFGAQVHELAQPFREPAQGDAVVGAPVLQFFDTAVGEVHLPSLAS